jgi:hypothetical protein
VIHARLNALANGGLQLPELAAHQGDGHVVQQLIVR